MRSKVSASICDVTFVCCSFQIDMGAFEETFKTKAQDSDADQARMKKIVEAKQKRGTSIIDVNRARNLGKFLIVSVNGSDSSPSRLGKKAKKQKNDNFQESEMRDAFSISRKTCWPDYLTTTTALIGSTFDFCKDLLPISIAGATIT